MKLFSICICIMFILTGCLERSMQRLPNAWKIYYKERKNDTPFEQVSKDMRMCGFTEQDVYYTSILDSESYVKATLCMEKKGYKDKSIKGRSICTTPFRTSNACKKENN